MKNAKFILAAASSVLMFGLSPAALAEESPGLVTVDIRGVAKNIAQNINIDASQIPGTVEIQPWVAAAVCNVSAGSLSAGQQARARCTAKATTPDLDQIVRRQIKGETQ
jgi:hypothetical protein